MREFQNRTLPAEKDGGIPLYRSNSNVLCKTLRIGSDNFHLTQNTINIGVGPADLPFVIRQPISKGVGFFLYTDKYAAL
jgi:hypothetical protein